MIFCLYEGMVYALDVIWLVELYIDYKINSSIQSFVEIYHFL